MDMNDSNPRRCRKLKRGAQAFLCTSYMNLCDVQLCLCCTAAVAAMPLLYCGWMRLKFRGTVGWSSFLGDMCSGWHDHIIRTQVHTEAPFADVNKTNTLSATTVTHGRFCCRYFKSSSREVKKIK